MKNTARWLGWFWGLAWAASAAGAQGPIARTYVLSEAPSASDLKRYAAIPGPKGYRVTLQEPRKGDLERTLRLPDATRIEFRFTEAPSVALLPEFQALARQVPEAMFLFKDPLRPEEIQRVLQAGFSRVWISLQHYPGGGLELKALSLLGPEAWLIFNTGRYPKPDEQGVMLQLPANLGGIQIVSLSWPRYYAMDFLNRLPQPKRLNVVDISPMQSDIAYLKNLHRLERLVLETDSDPTAEVWGWLSGLPIAWVRSKGVPSVSKLEALKAGLGEGVSGFEKLVIHEGRDLTAGERARLEAWGLPVEVRIDEADGGAWGLQ